MSVAELLLSRQKELENLKASVERDLADVQVALNAIAAKREALPEIAVKQALVQHPMNVDAAIILAVGAGVGSPSAMLNHLSQHLGVNTTIGSIRTRVSKLRRAGKLAHDGTAWVLPSPKLPMGGGEELGQTNLLKFEPPKPTAIG